MKIVIIGYSGSGKSTLAKHLGKKYKVDVLHLDRVHWLPNWTENTLENKIFAVEDFLNSHTSWIIDGNYFKLLFERRLEEADMIIFMNFNRFNRLYRAFKRFLKYRNTVRDDISNGCYEKMDLEFINWILYSGRTKEYKNHFSSVMKKYKLKSVEIKNQKQLDFFVYKNNI